MVFVAAIGPSHRSIRWATLAVMLLTPANVVLSSLIWSQWQEGTSYGEVAAMSLLGVAMTGALALVSRMAFSNTVDTNVEKGVGAPGSVQTDLGPTGETA